MSKENLIEFLKCRGNLTDKECNIIKNIFHHRNIRKGDLLLKVGDICNEIYFVLKGVIRVYNYTESGLEFTRLIITENKFGSNLQSFTNRLPSIENIQAIEDSEVFYINYRDFVWFNENHSNGMSIYRKILEEFQTFHIKRFEFLTNFSTKQKVEKFLQENLDLSQRLNNKIIASYLQMTPETYCRIKNSLKKS